MAMKVKSDQVLRECFDYILGAGANTLWQMKAWPDEVLVIHRVSVYNTAQANTGICHHVVKHNGDIRYIWSNAAITAVMAETMEWDIYLAHGDEIGIIITPNAAGDEIEMTYEGMRFRDDEYDNPT